MGARELAAHDVVRSAGPGSTSAGSWSGRVRPSPARITPSSEPPRNAPRSRSRRPMVRVGIQLPWFTFPGGPGGIAPRLSEIAEAAEDAGFASLWVMDHLWQLPADTGWGGPEAPMLEAYATLGFLARATTRIRLGALV